MLRPRWKKILADFWENKARSLLVVLSIAIGAFAVGMIWVSYVILPESMDAVYSGSVPANIRITTDEFDDDLLNTIKRIDGVAEVEGRSAIFLRVRVKDKDSTWHTMNINALKDFEDQKINLLKIQQGKSVPEGDSIILLESSMEKIGASLGDILEIKLADNSIKELQIVGTTHDYTMGIDSIMNSKIAYINFDTLKTLHEPASYNTLLVTVEGDRNDEDYIRSVSSLVSDKLESNGKKIYKNEISLQNQHPFENYIQAVINILGIMGILTVVLSSFLIVNTMNSLMTQQLRQIGIMKLVGGKRKQIIFIYLALILVYGIISLILAVPSAAYVGHLISTEVAKILNGSLINTNTIPLVPSAILIQALVAIIVPLCAALVPILQGSSVTVQQALNGSMIRDTGKPSGFDNWLDALRWKNGIVLLAVRNTFRRKGRLILTLFTLSLGGAIFIAVFNVQVSLDQQIARILSYASADCYLEFNRDYPIEKIKEETLTLAGVKDVEAWLSVTAQLNENGQTETVSIVAPPDDTQIVDKVAREGRWVNEKDQNALVVNEAFLNTYPDLKPGDTITLKINLKEEDWVVTGIFQYAGLDQKMAYTNQSSLSDILHKTTRSTSYRVILDRHDLNYEIQKANEIDIYFRELGYDVNYTTAVKERVNDVSEKMNMVIFVLLISAILTGLVGSVGLSGTLSLNVLERTSEIGILRAIGAYDKIVADLVIIEGMLVGIASYLIGSLLSFPITNILSNVVNLALFQAPAAFAITSKGFLFWFAIVIIFSFFASYFPARNATRLTIREVLAYE